MRFDADTGRLDVVPDAPAYGTKLRWSAPKLIAAANAEVPGANVRSLHVLPPAPGDAGSASAAADPGLRPAAPEAPVRTRETASPGYQRALAAHQASRPEPVLDPRTAAAIGQQNAGSSMREPEEAFGDGQAAIEELRVKAARAAAADSSHVRVLRRDRAERTGFAPIHLALVFGIDEKTAIRYADSARALLEQTAEHSPSPSGKELGPD
ncbi:hypothetical protein [Streptomyces violaceusniger]|uniref:hypothetical protein n=1 Tax=Streptomyces violaceusniger TaxID=68280 RepID=UPI0009966ACC|nr:hypothetical protein SHXM_00109 [Streptomyces hygroscopicus]